MSNIWDYVNAINSGKDIMSGTDNDTLAEKGYNPFIINRHFSYFTDTILVANEMNLNFHLDNKQQFDFLINMIRPRKRFTKWSKTEHHADLEAVAAYFKYSYEKAKQVMDILSSHQIEEIKKKLEKGGLQK
jgi:methyltransferase-like protein